ncbi:cationic amino acid transporter 5 [Quercus suber]|uniref:Cationic amino acid transporter 5 n=1 Tax=Quercus suber TaxID=58331 RepID=A0AAW0K456_QUESU
MGKVSGSSCCPKGDDNCSSGRDTRTGTILILHEMKMRLVFHNFHLIQPSFVCPTKDRNPISTTLLSCLLSQVPLFFSSGMDVLAPVRTLFILIMMAVALLVRRYYVREITPQINLPKLAIFLLMFIASSMATSVYGGLKNNGWLGYTVTVHLRFLGTAGISMFFPQQRMPKLCGIPPVPWFPSLSIATNIFLIGSLSSEAFIRFGICSLVMLI